MKERELNQDIKEVLVLYAGDSNQIYNSRRHYPKGVQNIDKFAKYVLDKEEYAVMARKIGLASHDEKPYTPHDSNDKEKVLFYSAVHYKKTPVKEICNELGYKRKEIWAIVQRGMEKLKDYHKKVQKIGEDEALLDSKVKNGHYDYDLEFEFGRRGLGCINSKLEEIEKKHDIKITEDIYNSIGEALTIRDHIMSKSIHEAGFSNELQRAIYKTGYHTHHDRSEYHLPLADIKDFKKFSLEELARMGNIANHLEELQEQLEGLGIVLQSN